MRGGIDIGGTKIGVCLGDESGSLLAKHRSETDAGSAPEDLMDSALRALEELTLATGSGPIESLGISCPGPFDRRTRTFLSPPNLPAWHGFELGAYLDRSLPCPTRSMNDANATALAEWLWGGHEHATTLVYLTMSTGFGAGIVIDGRVIEGARGFAGEVGRIRLDEFGPVGFGEMGTAEGFLSGPGLVQLAHAEILRSRQIGRDTPLASLDPLTTRSICDLASGGVPSALRVTTLAARKLGQLIAIVANVLEPDAVVLGTIGAAHPDLFIPEATSAMKRDTVPEIAAKLHIVPSRLPDRGYHSALAVATAATR